MELGVMNRLAVYWADLIDNVGFARLLANFKKVGAYVETSWICTRNMAGAMLHSRSYIVV